MPAPKFPGGRIEIAPNVHNARYACPIEVVDRDEFQYIAGYEECSSRYGVSRSSYPYLTLEMIISGRGTLHLNGKRFTVESGFCFCGGPETDYTLRSSKEAPLIKYFLAFGKSTSGSAAPQKYLYPGFVIPFADPELLKKWNELILEECSSQSPAALENTASLIAILVRKLSPDASGKAAPQLTDALVTRALAEIDRNFKTLGSLQELSDSLSVSSEHLCRVFKANQKASPYRILTRRKMEHAYAQLKMTHVPIQEIALSLGFTDGFHFSRAFKKRYGLPPSALR